MGGGVDDKNRLLPKPGYTWMELVAPSRVALDVSEYNKVIVDALPGKEEDFCFRMMSSAEWEQVSITGVIGGEASGQIESGVTWWGDRVADSTNQRGGSVHVGENGKATWGGELGVLIAVPRVEVARRTIEARPAVSPTPGHIFDAYKTRGTMVASEAVKAVFYVSRDRNEGDYKCHQLKSNT